FFLFSLLITSLIVDNSPTDKGELGAPQSL
ncbi:hypothetical protein EV197_3507, partial [Aquimarina brevivitae]